MPDAPDAPLLDALLDSWDRNNAILVGLLRALPPDGLGARAAAGSPTVARLLTHVHFVRLVFVAEDAPEFARALPDHEWVDERDPDRIAAMLAESARAVRDAVRGRVEAARAMDIHYDHPILLLQHLVWHEGYHHGQIKLALKAAGRPLGDEVAGPVTWDVWMRKRRPSPAPPTEPAPEDRAALERVVARLEAAWNAADGPAFAAPFAADADFVNVRGDHARGRDAIAAGHAEILRTLYAASTNRYTVETARLLRPDVALVHVRAVLDVPGGPLAGRHDARYSAVLTREAGGWVVASFHNTHVAAPGPPR